MFKHIIESYLDTINMVLITGFNDLRLILDHESLVFEKLLHEINV